MVFHTQHKIEDEVKLLPGVRKENPPGKWMVILESKIIKTPTKQMNFYIRVVGLGWMGKI